MNIIEKQNISLSDDIIKLLNENKELFEFIVNHKDEIQSMCNKSNEQVSQDITTENYWGGLSISDYAFEKFIELSKDTFDEKFFKTYKYKPNSKDELQEIIIKRIKKDGPNCNLNDIDVSNITDMSELFNAYNNEIFKNFNCDISRWDVSNVKNMDWMFQGCRQFNGDLSKWNVSNLKSANCMFSDCIRFSCDISKWNMSNVMYAGGMFFNCCSFKCDLSDWTFINIIDMHGMFFNCPTKPLWYERYMRNYNKD